MHSVYFILAESSAVDGQTNLASAFQIIEEITTNAFPTIIGPLDLLFLVGRDVGDPTEVTATLSGTLNKKEFFSSPIEIKFQDKPRCRMQVRLQGLALTEPGDVKLRLRVPGKQKELGTWSFEARLDETMKGGIPAPLVIKPAHR